MKKIKNEDMRMEAVQEVMNSCSQEQKEEIMDSAETFFLVVTAKGNSRSQEHAMKCFFKYKELLDKAFGDHAKYNPIDITDVLAVLYFNDNGKNRLRILDFVNMMVYAMVSVEQEKV